MKTKDWSICVNMTIFGMIVVDSYYMAEDCGVFNESPQAFLKHLQRNSLIISIGWQQPAQGQCLQHQKQTTEIVSLSCMQLELTWHLQNVKGETQMANQSDVYYKEDAKCVLKSLLTSVPFANLILEKKAGGSHGIVIQKMVDVTVFKFIVLKTIRGSLTPKP